MTAEERAHAWIEEHVSPPSRHLAHSLVDGILRAAGETSGAEACQHEAEPYPAEMIVVSDEDFHANPLRNDWGPPRIVPCLKCGAPLDRGRDSRMISIPALEPAFSDDIDVPGSGPNGY